LAKREPPRPRCGDSAYNFSYWRSEDLQDCGLRPAQPKGSGDTIPTNGIEWRYISVILSMWESINKRIAAKA
jgi:hypothetical protein